MPQARHSLLISLGSNSTPENSIAYALSALGAYIPNLRASTPIYTEAVDFAYPSPQFLNVILWGETERTLSEVKHFLSALELAVGRTPQSMRAHPERIPLDADLILYDSLLLKPSDLSRPYLALGLSELCLPQLPR